MRHIKTFAVSKLLEGEITRETLAECMKVPIIGCMADKRRPEFQWRFDLTAAIKLLGLLRIWCPFDEELDKAGPSDLDGRYLGGWKMNVVPTDGFRVEILVYEE